VIVLKKFLSLFGTQLPLYERCTQSVLRDLSSQNLSRNSTTCYIAPTKTLEKFSKMREKGRFQTLKKGAEAPFSDTNYRLLINSLVRFHVLHRQFDTAAHIYVQYLNFNDVIHVDVVSHFVHALVSDL